jgi:hypothetical protein
MGQEGSRRKTGGTGFFFLDALPQISDGTACHLGCSIDVPMPSAPRRRHISKTARLVPLKLGLSVWPLPKSNFAHDRPQGPEIMDKVEAWFIVTALTNGIVLLAALA